MFLSMLLIFRMQPIPCMPFSLVGTVFCFPQDMIVFHLTTLKLKFEYLLITTCTSYKTDNCVNNYPALLLAADIIRCDLQMTIIEGENFTLQL